MTCDITKESPIAVIDSGLGGISVLKELRALMPNENFIYYGDSANAPYGEKSKEEVRAATAHIVSHLIEAGAKAVVIACNTATGAAIAYLRELYPQIPFIGIEPAIKPAALEGDHPTVLVMATPLTLRQEKFTRLLSQYEDMADFIKVPCHGLVELIESGVTEGEEMEKCLHTILDPYVADATPDAVVLGCTHYPHVKGTIKKVLGEGVQFYDGAVGVSKETKRRLCEKDMLRTSDSVGYCHIYNSSKDDSFFEKSMNLLNK